MMRSVFVVLALIGCGDNGGGGDDGNGDGGTGDDSNPVGPEDADNDGYSVDDDCNDGDPAINPGATEVCDGVDNDCDKTIDVGASDAKSYYADADGDTYGAGAATASCDPITGSVENDDDCDDANASVNPGATEVCDEANTDEDCDSLIDDADDSLDTTTATVAAYVDADGDGYGVDGAAVYVCDAGSGYAAVAGDCDDTSATAFPGAAEACGNAIDEDCNGTADDCRYSGALAATDAGARLKGSPGQYLGFDATPAGDLNGDGVGDLAVASADTGFNGYGVLVYNGPLSGDVEETSVTGMITSASKGDGLGADVQGIGDQDGDGYADLLVQTGMIYPYPGGLYVTLGPITGSHAADDIADATVASESGDYVGWYPSSGDVNGDGIQDLMFGAPGTNSSTGVSYVFYGPVTTGDLTTADADTSFTGMAAYNWTGGCNAANGDIDGDGINDMLVSAEQTNYAPGATYDGAAWLFYGPMSGAHDVDEGDVVFHGGASYTHLGWFTSTGGDLDGDGLDDVVLTAPAQGDGTLYLLYGSTVTGGSDFDVSTLADAMIAGDSGAYQQFGYYGDTAGDLDSDGNDDLAVGSWVSDGNNGTAWVFYGPLSGSMYAADAAFTVPGSSGQYMGASTVFVDDVTGDGADDLAIGAMGTAIMGKYAGIVLLFDGRTE